MDEKLEGIWGYTVVAHLYTNIPAFIRTHYREERKTVYGYIRFKLKTETYTFLNTKKKKKTSNFSFL
jgi:hypothetical protein